jgi:hypothetical protein
MPLALTNTALEGDVMNPCSFEHANYLFAAHAESEARIRRLLGRKNLAMVTPELEQEFKRAADIARLIEFALDEWVAVDEL